jgi:hypothetical protein
MSDLSPLSGVKRKLDFGAVRSVDDPKAEVAPLVNGVRHVGPFSPHVCSRAYNRNAFPRLK